MQIFFKFCLRYNFFQFVNNIHDEVINNCLLNSNIIYNFIISYFVRYFICQITASNIKLIKVLILSKSFQSFDEIVPMKVLSICLRIVTILKSLSFLFMKDFKYYIVFSWMQNSFKFCLSQKNFQFVNNNHDEVINNYLLNNETIYNLFVFF